MLTPIDTNTDLITREKRGTDRHMNRQRKPGVHTRDADAVIDTERQAGRQHRGRAFSTDRSLVAAFPLQLAALPLQLAAFPLQFCLRCLPNAD